MLLTLWLLFRVALASPLPNIDLTEDEVATLAKREMVVRMDESDQGGTTTAVIDVNAPAAKVLAAVLDVEARKHEVGSIKEVEVYHRSDTGLGARFEMKVFGKTIVLHTTYVVAADGTYCTYALDETKENDIVATEGVYAVKPQGEGSRLVYHGITDTGRSVPLWLRKWLATGQLEDQLEGIRDRAERSIQPVSTGN